jgi:hypothetical protein
MDVDNLQLVALSAAEMVPTQTALSAWCDRKVDALAAELADLREHLLLATANGWKLRGLQASISRTEKRIVYYEKIKDAVDAGYVLVPNFPVRVLAVRVDRDKQPQTTASYEGASEFNAKAELLPSGEGRYVDDRLFTTDESYDRTTAEGKKEHVRLYQSGDYDVPDFPHALVKPAVLAATQRAMAFKIFDRVGMVENTSGRDPIMVGQLLDPRGNDRLVTFFIAWWLNTESL